MKILSTVVIALLCLCKLQAQSAISIYFMQDGKRIDVQSNKVTLEKKPFDIVVVIPKDTNLLVNASFIADSYKAAKKGAAHSAIPGFTALGMAEVMNNADNELLIDNAAPMFWYYDSDADMRYNAATISGGVLTGTRTVKQFYIVTPASGKGIIVPVAEVPDPLYIVFAEQGHWSNKNAFCLPVKIEWKN